MIDNQSWVDDLKIFPGSIFFNDLTALQVA